MYDLIDSTYLAYHETGTKCIHLWNKMHLNLHNLHNDNRKTLDDNRETTIKMVGILEISEMMEEYNNTLQAFY